MEVLLKNISAVKSAITERLGISISPDINDIKNSRRADFHIRDYDLGNGGEVNINVIVTERLMLIYSAFRLMETKISEKLTEVLDLCNRRHNLVRFVIENDHISIETCCSLFPDNEQEAERLGHLLELYIFQLRDTLMDIAKAIDSNSSAKKEPAVSSSQVPQSKFDFSLFDQ